MKARLLLLAVCLTGATPVSVAQDAGQLARQRSVAEPVDACFKRPRGIDGSTLALDGLFDGETPRAAQQGASSVRCTVLPRASFSPRELDIRTPRGTVLGFGSGGQLYSIRPSGIADDLIPYQREDSFFVDSVFQTAATNRSIRRTTPRAQKGPARRGPSWHYHQAGTYQRGPLRGKAPYYSPVIFNRFDEDAGIYESLNLAQQAHVENRDHNADRFLVYVRFRHLGDDVFEVIQAWFNHSRNQDPAGNAPTTAIDFFNFPWLVLRSSSVPFVLASAGGQVVDLSDRIWPPGPGKVTPRAKWLGAFTGSGDDDQGMIFTLAEDLRTRLRVGKVDKRVVINTTDRQEAFKYDTRSNYVIGAIRTDITVDRGEAIAARFYLAFGPRADLVEKAERLHSRSAVRKLVLEASTEPSDLTALCRKPDSRLDPCSAGQSGEIVVTRKVCTACLPLYELTDTATERPVYSTEPYLDPEPTAHLVNPRYRPVRIVGWLFGKSATAPVGMTKRVLTATDPLGIRSHQSDVGEYAYFVPSRSLPVPADAPKN